MLASRSFTDAELDTTLEETNKLKVGPKPEFSDHTHPVQQSVHKVASGILSTQLVVSPAVFWPTHLMSQILVLLDLETVSVHPATKLEVCY